MIEIKDSKIVYVSRFYITEMEELLRYAARYGSLGFGSERFAEADEQRGDSAGKKFSEEFSIASVCFLSIIILRLSHVPC